MTMPQLLETPLTQRQRLNLLFSQLNTERQSFLPHWRELNDFILPRRGRFNTTDVNKGDRRNGKIVDSTATFAARTLGSGMHSGVTNPARPWFRLTTPDPDLAEFGPVKEWLHVVQQRMSSVMLKSNLYNVLPTLYQDIGVFGTSCMFLAEDPEQVIRCYPFPIGSYMLANDHRLKVRVFMREFRMTVRQLVEQFGVKNLSRHVKTLVDRHMWESWVDVVHAVYPNPNPDPTKLESRFKPYLGVYYEKGEDGTDRSGDAEFLQVAGFDEFPILAPRWELTGEDVYGTNCPGMTALGDIKQLQQGERRSLQAVDKIVNPPMVGPTGLRATRASILPGDITYLDTREGQQGFRPAHEVRISLQDLEFKQDQARFRIRRAFYEDLFLMLATSPSVHDARDMTAREIQERHEEKLLALGPVLEQLNQDQNDPLIDRTFAIMLRRDLIPPPPEELEGEDLRVEYISIMAQAQKMVGLGGLERFAMFVNTQAELDPSVLDKVDRDQLIDEHSEMTGIPPRVVRPDEEVAEIRAARAQQQQMAEQAEIAKTAGQGAAALANADTGGKNLLTDLLGSGLGGARE